MAPEIIQGQPYDHTVDIWGIGVITYVLLAGEYPFAASSEKEIRHKIISAQYEFPSPHWDQINEPKDFIRRCLVVDTSKRASVRDLIFHSWFCSKKITVNQDTFLVKRLSRIYDNIKVNRTISIAQSPKRSQPFIKTKI